jgi:hypothetical protein
VADRAAAKKLRPWYFVVAMTLMWVSGVVSATSGCSTFSYLRGDHEIIDRLQESRARTQHPAMKVELHSEEARLQALAKQHRSAFPVSVARILLGIVLTLVSGAALAGRSSARMLGVQIVMANLVLALLSYWLQGQVREAMLQVVTTHAVDALGVVPGMSIDASSELYRAMWAWRDRLRFAAFELALPLFALYALTRPRTKAFFDAVAAATVGEA